MNISKSVRRPRYRLDRFTAAGLQGNPAGSPAERELGVYLPPGYDDEPDRRYPVIYFLHGYGLDGGHLTVGSTEDVKRSLPFPVRLLAGGILKSLLYFETLDECILGGRLPPFILVQPDGSLHRSHLHGARRPDRSVVTKGSLYTDSPFTGRFGTYVFEEVIGYVDHHYRTQAGRAGRSLAGGSMGGYGALFGGILHPERFQAVAALSPAVNLLDLLDVELIVPYLKLLLGEKRAREWGRKDLEDILDTGARVFGGDSTAAREAWDGADLNRLAERTPGAFRDVRLLLNCEADDEFGFTGGTRRLHETLERLGVAHEFEIYSDPLAARYSSHTFGIAWHILPALRFCLGAE